MERGCMLKLPWLMRSGYYPEIGKNCSEGIKEVIGVKTSKQQIYGSLYDQFPNHSLVLIGEFFDSYWSIASNSIKSGA